MHLITGIDICELVHLTIKFKIHLFFCDFLHRKVLTLTAVVFICLLPGEVVSTVWAFGQVTEDEILYVLIALALTMFFLNGLLAPVLLCLMSEKHRTRFMFVFGRSCMYCCCCCTCCCCCWRRRRTGRVLRLKEERQSVNPSADGDEGLHLDTTII